MGDLLFSSELRSPSRMVMLFFCDARGTTPGCLQRGMRLGVSFGDGDGVPFLEDLTRERGAGEDPRSDTQSSVNESSQACDDMVTAGRDDAPRG